MRLAAIAALSALTWLLVLVAAVVLTACIAVAMPGTH